MAREYGVHKINVEVSITALPFFEKHGYTTMKEQKAKASPVVSYKLCNGKDFMNILKSLIIWICYFAKAPVK